MGPCTHHSEKRSARMSGRVVIFVALALLVVVAVCDETYDKAKAESMSKEHLVSALIKSQTKRASTRSKLESARKQILDLQAKLRKGNASNRPHMDEKTREANELKHKAEEKKKSEKKKEAKLAKKEKLSDILMEHGAKYMAFKMAKKYKHNKSDKQHAKVIAAARKGGRAGAVGPIRKVARAAAVAAVKKTRAAVKKAGKHIGKHKLRRMCVNAAKEAVKKLLKEQDDLVEKTAKKWTKLAIKKYPPLIMVSEHPDRPNHFVAPPMIHLSMDAPPAPEVKPLKDAKKKKAKKAVKKAKKVVKKAKKVAKKEVAKAAAKAKADAGKFVPEK